MQEFRRNAVTNAALLLQRLRRYPEASQYFRRLMELTEDAEVRRDAEFQIAMMAFQANDFTNAQRLLREFIRRYGSEASAAPVLVEAYWNVAECVRNLRRDGPEYRAALQDVEAAFQSSGQAPGSAAAYFAAKAAFALADADTQRAVSVTISRGCPGSREELIAALQSGIGQARTSITDPYVARMTTVEAFRVPEFFIAARVAEARAYERLLEATREALRNVDYRALVIETFRRAFTQELQGRGISGATLRRTLDTLMQRVEEDGRVDEGAFELQSQIEGALDASIASLSCDVVVRYVTATRVALAARVDNASTQYALNRLQAYSQEQIGQCIGEQQARDASFQPYVQGEFQRSTQRQSLERPAQYPVPPLAREAR